MKEQSLDGKRNGGYIARLARCYRDGRGTEVDMKKAARLMERAVKKGEESARPEMEALNASDKP